jgi:drug/metabolite transporter (DMT)-like permease
VYPENERLAAALLVGSSLCFATVGAGVKLASATLPNEMIVFARSFFGLVALLPWLLRPGSSLRTPCFRSHALRALSGLAAMYCFFHAIAHLPLAEAMMLNYSSPLWIPLIARVWLGEPIPRGVGAAAVLGFLGIAFILKPGLDFFSPAALIGAVSGMFTAVAMVSIRGLAKIEPTTRIVFYFALVTSMVSAGPLAWAWKMPPPAAWAVLLAMGVFANSGQLLLTRAYAHAPAARIGPMTYLTVVFAAVYGWLLWGEVPDRWSLAGAALVALAGALAIRAMAPAPIADEAVGEPSL